MKKLLLMRHAAANTHLLNQDIDRTLSEIGIAEIEQAKKFIANIRIDKILVSPSMRTKQTGELLSKDIISTKSQVQQELYSANTKTIFEIIQTENTEIESLLVIAHNPAIYQLALKLADKKQSDYEALIDSSMPTCTIVELDFEHLLKWQDLKINSGKIIKIFIPSN